eukprot:2666035-Pyramimonas_sp.AAC.1
MKVRRCSPVSKAEEGEEINSSQEDVAKEKKDVTKEKEVALEAPPRAVTVLPEQGATPTVVEGTDEITVAGASLLTGFDEALHGHGGESCPPDVARGSSRLAL